MAKYRKKPVVIDAVQLRWDTWSEMCDHVEQEPFDAGARGVFVTEDGLPTESMTDRIGLLLPTLEGVMLAVENDYVIRGIRGELYPCKPDIFEATYEEVEQSGYAIKAMIEAAV